MFTYKPWLIGESGFSLRVAYQLNYAFRIQIRSFTYKPRGFLPGLTVMFMYMRYGLLTTIPQCNLKQENSVILLCTIND